MSLEDNGASMENDAVSNAPQPEMAQETEQVAENKGSKRKRRVVDVEEIMPKPSYWPLAAAASFVMLLIGMLISWIVIAIGTVMLVACIVGWSLERR